MKRLHNKIINSENELIVSLIHFLNNLSYDTYIEVPNMGQSSDLVAIKNNKVTIIEAKMKDWKRALEQCRAHENVADYIYIAIASKKVSTKFFEEALQRGYGIIHCETTSGKCSIYSYAKNNLNIWNPQRMVFNSVLKEICYAH